MSASVSRRAAAPARTRYEDDLYTWVQEQVALLRAGRLDEVDAENVAEELSDVGKSEFSKMQSALEIVLIHMLTWDHQPEKKTRSWANSIAVHRRHYARVLRSNPGLRPRIAEALVEAYADARLGASSEADMPTTSFPAECPYGWDDILERPFDYDPPQPARRTRR